MEPTQFKKGTKPDDPPQNMDKPHLSASISTITNLDVTCTLDTSCDQLLHLDPPSHSSDAQDISIVENVEIEFLPEFEVQLDYANLSPTDVFLRHHDYDLFLLNQEIDTDLTISTFRTLMSVIMKMPALSMPPTLATPLHCPNSWHNLNPTDTPSAVPTAIQASNDHPFNPWCAHNLIATQ